MKNKIITIFLVMFFAVTILNLNEVFGVGLVSQAWKRYGEDNKLMLIFRTYSTPHSESLKNYHETNSTDIVQDGNREWTYEYKGNTYQSKWIYFDGQGLDKPQVKSYTTIALAFHTEKLAQYIPTEAQTKTGNNIGYTNLVAKEEGVKLADLVMSNEISSISQIINNSESIFANPDHKNNYDDKVFFEVPYANATLTKVDWGTGLVATGLSFANNIFLKATIVDVNDTSAYIIDNVVYDENVKNLVTKANEVGKTEGCYVTKVAMSQVIWSSQAERQSKYTAEIGEYSGKNAGAYEVSRDVEYFFEQYQKGGKYYGYWSTGTMGYEPGEGVTNDNNSIGSVANHYDNKIIFPQQSKRTVLVRHIDIGTNTTISTEIVNNGIPIESTNLTLKANDEIIRGRAESANEYTRDYQEYYEGIIPMDSNIVKQSLEDTSTYKCIGHNVAVSTSLQLAENTIDTVISNGKYNKETIVEVVAKDMLDDGDYIVIDFYYTEYDKQVEVNHIYLDKDGKIIEKEMQTIKPNDTALSGEEVINRINNDTYVVEKYIKSLGKDITASIAESLKEKIEDLTVQYLGYETFKQPKALASIIGSKRNNYITGYSNTAKISGDIVQVNFYYYQAEQVEVNHLYVDKDGFVIAKGKQTIVPNDTATEITELLPITLSRVNNDMYIKEIYIKKLNVNIETRRADSLESYIQSGEITYKGYETLEQKVSVDDLIGKQKTNLQTGNKAVIKGDILQVNYYYYTGNEVEVNHIYLDKDGCIMEIEKQTIIPNETAISGAETITRINIDEYIKEIYIKNIGKDIIVKTAESIKDNTEIEYLGYEKLKERVDIVSIIGKKKTDLNAETSATISNDILQVNFYYYKVKKELPEEPTEPDIKRVQVNHLYIDKNGNILDEVSQNIIPNTTVKVLPKGEYINRINGDTYVREVYEKTVGVDLKTRIADSLKTKLNAAEVRYMGAEVFGVETDSYSLSPRKTTELNANETININDIIVQVNFYYYKAEKVEVNHLYVDKDGYILALNKQLITPNRTAVSNKENIYRINSDTYIKEVYSKLAGIDITVRIADSLVNRIKSFTVEYMGYETLSRKVSVESLIGKLKEDLNTNTMVNITDTIVQVNYYYYVKENDNEPQEQFPEEPEPEKDIDGRVFVNPSPGNISTTCLDTDDSMQIVSVPSGSYATVGITGVPKFMAGAITTKYVTPKENELKKNITLIFNMGNESKTINYYAIKYRAGYFKVTDMAAYELKTTTVYDAQNGINGTIGTSIFNWANGKLDTRPSNMSLVVKLTGVNNKTITNNASAINNVDNYVLAQIKYDNNRTVNFSSNNVTLTKRFLSTSQFDSVNANGDDKIDEQDIFYAEEKLSDYYNIWQIKLQIKNDKQTTYNAAVNYTKEMEAEFKNVTNELNRLKGLYLSAKESKEEQEKTIANEEASLNNLENEVRPSQADKLKILNSELDDLKLELEELQNRKNEIDTDLAGIKMEERRLYKLYEAEKLKREQLQSNADCDDTVNIYSDKDELCSKAKEAYEENLKKRVVEKAYNAWEKYKTNTYDPAIRNQQNINSDIALKEIEISDKEDEISVLNSEIASTIETIEFLSTNIPILKNKLEKYTKDTYTPAKEAYENYLANEYDLANKNVKDAKEVEASALAELNASMKANNTAYSNYVNYNTYVNNLKRNYASYKALYDQFTNITEANAAKIFNLKLSVRVQNMLVTINNRVITRALSNVAIGTFDVQEMVNNRKNIPEVATEKPVIDKNIYTNIGTENTKESDYTNSNYIKPEKTNGIRALGGRVEYEAKTIIGNKNVKQIQDTVYYSDQSLNGKVVTFKLNTLKLSQTYKVNTTATNATEKYKQTRPINIYTPITVSAIMSADTNEIINQSQNTQANTSMIQLNTSFTIDLANNVKPAEYNINNTNKYSGGYYVKFDFDVHNVYINGRRYNNGNIVKAGTWIGIITKKDNRAYITAQAYGNLDGSDLDTVSEDNSSYVVRAVAYNTTDLMLDKSIKFDNLQKMIASTSELKETVFNICKNPSYFAETTYNVILINRAFEFRITDLKDVNWKSVFRTTTSSDTNKHKGVVYYSGSTKWNTESDKSNDIVPRTVAQIGRNPLKILPLGPYKNTDSTYSKAPKMGYRFSFDMKVTGSYYNKQGEVRENKKVNITTKFYYVSKDGKTYLKEYDGSGEGIYLFYKTSAGKYVRIDQNGGGYKLTFTPNDGYRYIQDNDTSTLSKKLVTLGNLRTITLTHDMATVASNGSVITYYGEYKLPNSTIAVKVNADGTYNINKPLTSGYVGVIFDIVAYAGTVKLDNATKDVQLSYDKDTKINPNTSQWDYEGFLGYTNYGYKVSTSNPVTMRLENGTWKITDKIYNEIKGSVILYDLDQRAATDYE